MNVKELIEILKKFPADLPVVVSQVGLAQKEVREAEKIGRNPAFHANNPIYAQDRVVLRT